jgi:hypothetical protein
VIGSPSLSLSLSPLLSVTPVDHNAQSHTWGISDIKQLGTLLPFLGDFWEIVQLLCEFPSENSISQSLTMFHAQYLGLTTEIHDLQYEHQALKMFDMHSAQKVVRNATSFLQQHGESQVSVS